MSLVTYLNIEISQQFCMKYMTAFMNQQKKSKQNRTLKQQQMKR